MSPGLFSYEWALEPTGAPDARGRAYWRANASTNETNAVSESAAPFRARSHSAALPRSPVSSSIR